MVRDRIETVTLSKIRTKLIFWGAVVTGILVDFLLFSVVILSGGVLGGWVLGAGLDPSTWAGVSLMIAQGAGAAGGMVHDFFITRCGAGDRRWGGRPSILLITVSFVALGSCPAVLFLGYLTNNLWVAKLTVSFVLHFSFCLFLTKHYSPKQ